MVRGMIITAVLLLSSSLVAAETNAGKAKELFDRAEISYRLGKFQEALRGYEGALKLHQRASIVFNIAQCYRQLGKPQKAVFFYKLFLSDWERERPGTAPPNQDEVRGYIEQLTAEMRRPAPEAPPASDKVRVGQLLLEGLPDGAEISVDGTASGSAPISAPLFLDAGEHQLQINAKGFLPWSLTVNITPGELTTERPALQPATEASPGRSKFWLVAGISTAGAAVVGGIVGIAFNVKANNGTPEDFDSQRGISVAGYVFAGTFAVASAVSWYLYYRSGEERTTATAAAITPVPGGAVGTALLRF